jgi:hypothetical protein
MMEDSEEEEPFADDRFDLTDEGPAPAEIGGYVVGCRMYWKDKDDSHTMEGFFHLVDNDGTWKIEDLYFTSFDNQAAPEPISLAVNYREMFANPEEVVSSDGNGSGTSPASPLDELSSQTERVARHSVYKILRSNGKAILVAVGAMLLAVLSAIGKAVMGGGDDDKQST